MELAHQQICGNQSGSEVHGEHQQEGEKRPALQSLLREGISRTGADHHAQHRKNQGHDNAVQHCVNQTAILKDRHIGVQGDSLGPEGNLLCHHKVVAGNGFRQQMDKGKDTGQTQKHYDRHHNEIAEAESVNGSVSVAAYLCTAYYLFFFLCHCLYLLQ